MAPTDFLAQIEQRLAALEARLSELADRGLIGQVERAIQIARIDQPFALAKARQVLEWIVRDIYRRELPEEAPKPLFDMIGALCNKKGLLNSRITADLDYIRIKGNLVLHPGDEPLEASEREVEIILLLTINLVEWYLTGYLPEPEEARGEAPPLPACPYRGLHAFREADAAHYFGREPDVADVLTAVERQPLVAVVGPSGSGKSSLAFAGVAAEQRQHGIWAIAAFRPRAQPERGLAQALVALWASDPVERLAQAERLAAHWAAGEIPLTEALRESLRQSQASRLLLIADQFEELYTQGLPQAQLQRFLDQLTAAVAEAAATPGEAPALCLLLTLRADFLGHALAHPGLAAAMDRYPKKLLGPVEDPQRLRAIIEQPARNANVLLEELLAERILRDLAQLPGESEQGASLPLLEFTLEQLWERQQERRLTHLGYEALGGIHQALARHADALYQRLAEHERNQMRQILVQLVRPGEGTEDTRQVATREQLRPEHWPLITRLADQRLLVTGHDQTTDQDTAELIHEALIRHWPPLRQWIDQDRAFRTWQNRLRQALQDWESSGRESDALLRGARLAEAEERLVAHRESLSESEQEYIAASVAEREREVRARRRRMRFTIAGLAVGLLIAIGLFLWANEQRELARKAEASAQTQAEVAKEQRHVAEAREKEAKTQETISLARQLAAQSTLALTSPPIDLVKGTLLAVESHHRAQTLEGSRAWSRAMELLPRDVLRLEHEGDVGAFAFSPDGKLVGTLINLGSGTKWGKVQILNIGSHEVTTSVKHDGAIIDVAFDSSGRLMASVGMDRRLIITDIETGEPRYSLVHAASLLAVDFSPDGDLMAIGGEDGSVCVKTAATGATRFCQRHQGAVISVAFTPDGKYLVSGSEDGSARIWDLKSHEELYRFTHGSKLIAAELSPDGSRLATAAEDDPVVRVWDIRNGGLALTLTHDARVVDVRFSSNNKQIITSAWDNTARVWDAETGAELQRLSHERDLVRVLAMSPDNDLAITVNGWWEHEAIVWNTRTGELEFRAKHDDEVIWAAFAPDGKTLVTSTEDKGALWIWDLATKRSVARLMQEGTINRLRFGPDGQRVVVATGPTGNNPYMSRKAFSWGVAFVWDADSGKLVHRLGDHPWHMTALAFDARGKRLATADARRDIKIWDLASGAEDLSFRANAFVHSLAFAPNDKLLVNSSVWDLKNKSKVADFSEAGGVSSFDVSTDGLHILTEGLSGDSGDGSRLWDVRTGKKVAHLDPSQRLSPDGRLVGRVLEFRTVEIKERESGMTISNLSHDIDVVNYAFDSEGGRLAVRLKDASIALWDLVASRRIARIRHSEPTDSKETLREYRFSPYGRLLATRSSFSTKVKVWESATGTLVSELKADGIMGMSMRFSDDGRSMLTVTALGGEQGGAIRVWDVETGNAYFDVHPSNLKAFPIFSPDGRWLVFGTLEGAEIWDLAEQQRLLSVTHDMPLQGVSKLAFSPDGRLLVTAGFDRTARVWDTASGRELRRLPHTNWVEQIAFADGGKFIVTRDMDGVARVWDPTTGHAMFRLIHGSAILQRTIVTKDGRYVAIVLGSRVRVWETDTGELLSDVDHGGNAGTIALSSDGSLLATVPIDFGGRDDPPEPVRVWEVASGREIFQLEPASPISSLSFSADDTRILTGSADNTARIWSAETGRELVRLTHNAKPEKVILREDNAYLAARVAPGSGAEASFVVWHVPSRQVIARVPRNTNSGEFKAVFRPGAGVHLATKEGDSILRISDASSAQVAALMLEHEDVVTDVSISPDSMRLASLIGSVKYEYVPIWDLATGKELYRVVHDEPVWDVAISPDGKRLATASSDQIARIWDITDGRELQRLSHNQKVHRVKFSPDSRWLATFIGGIDSGTYNQWEEDLLQVWDAASGEAAGLMVGGYIRSFAFSPDGNRLVTGEGTFGPEDQRRFGFFGARIWDVATGEELLRIPTDRPGGFARFSPDGSSAATLALGYRGEPLRLWDSQTGRPAKDVVRFMAGNMGSIRRLAIDTGWKHLAVEGTDPSNVKDVQIWNLKSGEKEAALVHDGSLGEFATASECGWIDGSRS